MACALKSSTSALLSNTIGWLKRLPDQYRRYAEPQLEQRRDVHRPRAPALTTAPGTDPSPEPPRAGQRLRQARAPREFRCPADQSPYQHRTAQGPSLASPSEATDALIELAPERQHGLPRGSAPDPGPPSEISDDGHQAGSLRPCTGTAAREPPAAPRPSRFAVASGEPCPAGEPRAKDEPARPRRSR